jgi:phage tail P2-like protein
MEGSKMINLKDGLISDHWPHPDEETQSFAYALKMAISDLVSYADRTQCYSAVEKLDNDTLDLLAVELRAAGYDQSYDLEIKRKVIKAALMACSQAGTAAAVKAFVNSIYSESEVDEWYEYGGDPGHYRIGFVIDGQLQTIPIMSADEMYEFLRRINRLSAYLDGVSYIIRHRIELGVGVSLYQISPPFCGTIYCGTYPEEKTRGYSVQPGINIGADPGGHTADPPITGTVPETATIGGSLRASLVSDPETLQRAADASESGTIYCGTMP